MACIRLPDSGPVRRERRHCGIRNDPQPWKYRTPTSSYVTLPKLFRQSSDEVHRVVRIWNGHVGVLIEGARLRDQSDRLARNQIEDAAKLPAFRQPGEQSVAAVQESFVGTKGQLQRSVGLEGMGSMERQEPLVQMPVPSIPVE